MLNAKPHVSNTDLALLQRSPTKPSKWMTRESGRCTAILSTDEKSNMRTGGANEGKRSSRRANFKLESLVLKRVRPASVHGTPRSRSYLSFIKDPAHLRAIFTVLAGRCAAEIPNPAPGAPVLEGIIAFAYLLGRSILWFGVLSAGTAVQCTRLEHFLRRRPSVCLSHKTYPGAALLAWEASLRKPNET